MVDIYAKFFSKKSSEVVVVSRRGRFLFFFAYIGVHIGSLGEQPSLPSSLFDYLLLYILFFFSHLACFDVHISLFFLNFCFFFLNFCFHILCKCL